MDGLITSHILRHLLDHRFESKAEMARQLDVPLRTIQRVFENTAQNIAGTVVLDKALAYCARHHISLDPVLNDFDTTMQGKVDRMPANDTKPKAYAQLRLSEPPGLNEEGRMMYRSMLRFLQRASAHACPCCETWCNPWDGKRSAESFPCYIGHMAKEILRDITEIYGGEAVEQPQANGEEVIIP